jgi:hypothetical protein
VVKHPQANLCPSELVTIGVLMALKGVSLRAFYRWLARDDAVLFGGLPDRTRLLRALEAHQTWCDLFLTWLLELRQYTRDELIDAQRKTAPGWSESELEPWADSKLRVSLNEFIFSTRACRPVWIGLRVCRALLVQSLSSRRTLRAVRLSPLMPLQSYRPSSRSFVWRAFLRPDTVFTVISSSRTSTMFKSTWRSFEGDYSQLATGGYATQGHDRD